MAQKILPKPAAVHLVCALIALLLCPLFIEAQILEPIYAQEHAEVYRQKGVKEVLVEREIFHNGKVTYPRHPEQRFLIDKNGRTTRYEREGTSSGIFYYRYDKTYDQKGNLLSTTAFTRKTEPGATEKETPVAAISWVPYERTVYTKAGKDQPGEYHWVPDSNSWKRTATLRTYTKRDTTYTIKEELEYQSKEVTRQYRLGTDKSVTRTDHLSYSPKGLGEPDYYYSKTENGRVVETGSVDFLVEGIVHMEKYPEEQRFLFGSKNNANQLFDRVARLYPGTFEPISKYTYNDKGLLIKETIFDDPITYERDSEGKVTLRKKVHSDGSGTTTVYHYNSKGLVEKEVSHYLDGRPEQNRYYQYSYY